MFPIDFLAFVQIKCTTRCRILSCYNSVCPKNNRKILMNKNQFPARFCCLVFTVFAFLLPSQTVRAAEYLVSSASDILGANPLPGDTLVMSNGDWIDQTINFSAMGTSTKPITLRAQTPGEVVLSGTSTLNISGEWLTKTYKDTHFVKL